MPETNVARGVAEPAPRVEYELQLYYWMKLIRAFEERVSRLHRQNKILGGVYSGAGQEAIVTGICAPLHDGDFVAPLHRDMGVFIMRGVDPGRLMAQLMGKETGLSRGKDSFLHGGDLEHGVFGSTSMLGSSLPVAVGAALKFKMKKNPNVAVAFFGEGAASRGDVHEAMNFAGVQRCRSFSCARTTATRTRRRSKSRWRSKTSRTARRPTASRVTCARATICSRCSS